jgi:hypothetical protein
MKIIQFTFFFILLATSICWTGCEMFASHTNPLAGWHSASKNPDKIIEKDYQDYIQTLSPEERKYAGPVLVFEDGTGQYAVDINIGINGTSWHHVLIYDKDNKRIKTIKYSSGNYGS